MNRDAILELLRKAQDLLAPTEHVLIAISGPHGTEWAGCCEKSEGVIRDALTHPDESVREAIDPDEMYRQ